MVAIRTPRASRTEIEMSSGNVNWAGGQFMALGSNNHTPQGSIVSRQCVFPIACTMSRATIEITVNLNTAGGAELVNVVDGLDGNIIIPVDQVVARVQNITDTDDVPNLGRQSFRYDNFDANFTTNGIGCALTR